jgi:hypothetical protein
MVVNTTMRPRLLRVSGYRDYGAMRRSTSSRRMKW